MEEEPKLRMKEAKAIVKAIIEQNIDMRKSGAEMGALNIPYLLGEPGIGKTAIMHQIAKELGIGCETVILAQYDLGDLGGLPYLENITNKNGKIKGKKYVRARPFFMPTKGKGILFLDEVTQAFMANQNIAAQLTNEGRIGEHVLPEGWVVALASNEAANRAGTNPMPSHLKDRICWLPCKSYHDDVIELFNRKRLDERLPAYLRWRPDFLSQFDPEKDVCPSPRSWEKVNAHLINKAFPNEEARRRAIIGTVGQAAAADFHAFMQVWGRMPDPDLVFKDPKKADIPKDEDVKYALCAALSARTTEANAKAICLYAERLLSESAGEYGIYLVRDAIDRSGGLKSKLATRHKEVKAFLRMHGRAMYELYEDIHEENEEVDRVA